MGRVIKDIRQRNESKLVKHVLGSQREGVRYSISNVMLGILLIRNLLVKIFFTYVVHDPLPRKSVWELNERCLPRTLQLVVVL